VHKSTPHDFCKQTSTGQKQIRQRCQHVELAAVLGQAAQPGFLKAKLLLEHPKRVLNLGAGVSLGGLDQALQTSLWNVGQAAAVARPHRHPKPQWDTWHHKHFLRCPGIWHRRKREPHTME